MKFRPTPAVSRGATLLAVLTLMLLTGGCNGGGGNHLFLLRATQTPTSTPMPTATPTPTATSTPTATPTAVFVNFGVAVVGDDGSGFSNGLQVMTVEDSTGKPLPTPESTFAPLSAGDIDGLSITPDGTHGALIDGGNLVHFFTADLSKGTIDISPATVDVTSLGGDGDSIASLPGGDQVVVSAGGSTDLALISGVLSGTPAIAAMIPTSKRGPEYDGLVLSVDGKVMLSRAGSGGLLDVYSIAPGTPVFTFTLTNTVTVPAVNQDGREGMAISPIDSTRAVIVGTDGSVNLLTDLPAKVTFKSNIKLASAARAVTITTDGKFAIVAAAGGLVVVGGVDTGTLAQVGAVYSPTFTVPAPVGTCTLNLPLTLAELADGKFIVAIQNCGLPQSATDIGSGVMLTIPISAAGALGAPVGQLNFVVTPANDQLVTH